MQSLFVFINSTDGLFKADASYVLFLRVSPLCLQKRHLAKGPNKGQVNQFGSNYSHYQPSFFFLSIIFLVYHRLNVQV